MKINRLLSKLPFLLLLIMILACSEDDTGNGNDTGFQFAGISSSYYEEDGDVNIMIPFRNANANISESDIVIDGTATEGDDYEIVGVSKEGIEVIVKDDLAAELIETIRFSITGATGNAIHTVKLQSNDPGFMKVQLNWTADVDLDLFSLYYHEDTEEWEIIDFSDPGNTLDPIDWTDPDGMYGFSYNYFAGAVDNVSLSSVFTPTGVTLEGGTDPLTFNAVYTLANVDPDNIQIEQMVTKSGTEFTDFSEIMVPEEGSRHAELLIKMRKTIAEYKANLSN